MNTTDLKEYFTKFRNKRILLIGDAIIDQYIFGAATKISPDAPVPLVDVQSESNFLGSLITTIKYIQTLGGEVELITNIGNDFEGEFLLKAIDDLNIGRKGILKIGDHTPKITRIMAQDQQLLRIEKKYEISIEKMQELNSTIEALLEERIERCDAVLISDYNLGLLNPILITQILAIAARANKPVVARPEVNKYYLYKNIQLISMNRNIASSATGVNPVNETGMRIMGTKLLNELRSGGIFIPWVEGDSYFFQGDEVLIHPTLLQFKAQYYSNIGSATLAAISLMISLQAPLSTAIEVAHYAGALSSTQPRGDVFSLEELQEVIKSGKISTR